MWNLQWNGRLPLHFPAPGGRRSLYPIWRAQPRCLHARNHRTSSGPANAGKPRLFNKPGTPGMAPLTPSHFAPGWTMFLAREGDGAWWTDTTVTFPKIPAEQVDPGHSHARHSLAHLHAKKALEMTEHGRSSSAGPSPVFLQLYPPVPPAGPRPPPPPTLPNPASHLNRGNTVPPSAHGLIDPLPFMKVPGQHHAGAHPLSSMLPIGVLAGPKGRNDS